MMSHDGYNTDGQHTADKKMVDEYGTLYEFWNIQEWTNKFIS